MLNYALRDEDVWNIEGIVPPILSALEGCEQIPSPYWRFTQCERVFYFLLFTQCESLLLFTFSFTFLLLLFTQCERVFYFLLLLFNFYFYFLLNVRVFYFLLLIFTFYSM